MIKLSDSRVLLIKSGYHAEICDAMLDGAKKTLLNRGLDENKITTITSSGAFEFSVLAAEAARLKKWDAIICLGCVIKGETAHFDFICSSVAHSLAQVGITHLIPVIFGVLTTANVEQALVRSGLKSPIVATDSELNSKQPVCNKGIEAAEACLQTLQNLIDLRVQV